MPLIRTIFVSVLDYSQEVQCVQEMSRKLTLLLIDF